MFVFHFGKKCKARPLSSVLSVKVDYVLPSNLLTIALNTNTYTSYSALTCVHILSIIFY